MVAESFTMTVLCIRWLLALPATHSTGSSSSSGAPELKLKHSTLDPAFLGTATNSEGLYFKKDYIISKGRKSEIIGTI